MGHSLCLFRLTQSDGPRALHGQLFGPAVEPRAEVAANDDRGRLVLLGRRRGRRRQARERARLLQHLDVHFFDPSLPPLSPYHFFMLSPSLIGHVKAVRKHKQR